MKGSGEQKFQLDFKRHYWSIIRPNLTAKSFVKILKIYREILIEYQHSPVL